MDLVITFGFAMPPPFVKRSFTAITLVYAFARMLRYSAWAIWAYVFRGIDRQLAEKILLVISSVNGCRYCQWFHARLALRSGVDESEVAQILDHLLPEQSGQQERTVLRFSLHYAESAARPSAPELEHLASEYSPCQVSGILGLCSAIHFGNLSGNTFDAFLSRLRGNSIEGGSPLVEALVFLLCAPFLLPVMSRVSRDHGK